MKYDDDFDTGSERYETKKKFKRTGDNDKRIKNPVNKGSIRTKEKKSLRQYIDRHLGSDPEEWDEFEDEE